LRAGKLSIAAALLGLAASIALIRWFGFHRVLAAALAVGWRGGSVLILWQGVLYVVLGVAWWALVPGRPRLRVLVWARAVRDAAANCLPFSVVGGLVFGARTATTGGLAWPMASASALADVTLEFLTQLIFAAGGLALLMAERPDLPLALPIWAGIGIGLIGALAFIALQRGSAGLVRRPARRFGMPWLTTLAARILLMREELRQIYATPLRFIVSSALHLAGWIINGVGGWFIMRFTGATIGLPAALAIEGLLQLMLTAAFAIPGFAGVQEAAYVGIGGLFGLMPDTAIAVSLVRRVRDVVVGVPILIAWQIAEARRFESRRPT